MDDIDTAWLQSCTPEGCTPSGFISVVSFLDSEGNLCWKVYNQLDASLSTSLGLLELAKLDLVARTDTGLTLRYEEDD